MTRTTKTIYWAAENKLFIYLTSYLYNYIITHYFFIQSLQNKYFHPPFTFDIFIYS